MSYVTGDKEYFSGIGKIAYEGNSSDNPLAFKFYDENKIVAGKTLKEHLRFAVAYWHTFCGTGGDPFGPGTIQFLWDEGSDQVARGMQKMESSVSKSCGNLRL